ncbi:MAG: aspartyl protease family protein, partial [Candidatus Obscuribacterales bacterium]|nr:aspartyl protease family protein [Candidatus Obscuribacterales bacterium]
MRNRRAALCTALVLLVLLTGLAPPPEAIAANSTDSDTAATTSPEVPLTDTESGADPTYDAIEGNILENTTPPVSEPSDAIDSSFDDKVESIVGKAIEAYGGTEALRGFEKNATIFGRVVPGGGTLKNAFSYRKYRNGKKWRVDLEAPDTGAGGSQGPAKRVLAFNGLAGWRSTGNTVVDLNPIRLAQLNDDNDYQPSLLLNWGEDDWQFTMLGRSTFRQVPVYSVQVEGPDHRKVVLSIDKRNFLVVGISYNTENGASEEKRKISVEYAEYRPNFGTMFPYKQIKLINGNVASELVISSVSLDDPIQVSVFDRPQSAGKVTLARPVTVDFEYTQKEILVKGRLNSGEELLFLFDTGASDTLIDRRVAAEHFLAKQG